MAKQAKKPGQDQSVSEHPSGADVAESAAEPVPGCGAGETLGQGGNGAGGPSPAASEPAPGAAEQGGSSGEATETRAVEALRTELEAARGKADEYWDRLLRTQAEMENLRKRSQRDVENAHKFALEGFAGELLGVRDSLEMGLAAAAQEGADVAGIREGTELTLKMLAQAMEKFSIREVDPLGEKFDPALHQAMTMLEDQQAESNTVISVIQKGYTLNDRLLRPALVTVAK